MILVIGDSCRDVFVYGDCKRICPEAPVPVFNPCYTTKNPGMASNVSRNLESLGSEVELITNTGQMNKTRFVEKNSNQMLVRVDDIDKVESLQLKDIEQLPWDKYKAVVISDYNKGFLSKEIIRFIATKHPLTFLDTKKLLGDWAENISFIKINEFEHKKNFERLPNYPFILDKMIVTIGSKGCKYKNKIYSVPEVSVKDVSGAGDTFLAGLVTNYLKHNNIEQAIKFANECATIVVQKRGVTTL